MVSQARTTTWAVAVAREAPPDETQTFEFDLGSISRRFTEGQTRLTLATTDAGFNGACQAAGVVVDHADATLPVHALDGAENLGSWVESQPDRGRRSGSDGRRMTAAASGW